MNAIHADIWEVFRRRRSVRAFTDDEVDDTAVRRILDAARLAPSAGDLQAYRMAVVRSRAGLRALADAAGGQSFIAAARLAIVFLADPERSRRRYRERGKRLFCVQDATIACAYAQLAATALGLGSVWVGAFHDRAVQIAVDAPDPLTPVSILVVGHAGESPPPTPRRSVDELVLSSVARSPRARGLSGESARRSLRPFARAPERVGERP
jgi:nitroreductase